MMLSGPLEAATRQFGAQAGGLMPALAGARNLWTIPAQVVQIDIAISATEPSGCVERRQARPRVHGVPSLELGSEAVEGGARPGPP